MTKKKTNGNVMQPSVQINEKDKEKFLLIPLFALKGMIDDSLGLAKAVQIGIYITASRLETSDKFGAQYECGPKLAKECIYSVINNSRRNIYSADFFDQAVQKTKEILEEKHLTASFAPGVIDTISFELEKSCVQTNLYKNLCLWYLMKEYFPQDCTPWKSNKDAIEYCIANNYDDSEQKNLFCLVNLKIIQNLLLTHESYMGDDAKQREYRARIAMWLGCASIIGSSTFKATTSDMIKCRMFGAINDDELQELLANEEKLSETYNFFTTRRRYDKLLSDLQLSKLLGECPWKRRTYISLRIPDSVKLQQTVINKGKDRQRKDLSERKAALRAAAKTQTMV